MPRNSHNFFDEQELEKTRSKTREELILVFMLAAYMAVQQYNLDVDLSDVYLDAVEFADKRSEEIVTSVRDTTNKAIEAAVLTSATLALLVLALRTIFALSAEHSALIAIAEFIRARNLGSIAVFERAGVQNVLISDGLEFDQPCVDADGQIWTLEQYKANPLEHPRCRRQATPIFE